MSVVGKCWRKKSLSYATMMLPHLIYGTMASNSVLNWPTQSSLQERWKVKIQWGLPDGKIFQKVLKLHFKLFSNTPILIRGTSSLGRFRLTGVIWNLMQKYIAMLDSMVNLHPTNEKIRVYEIWLNQNSVSHCQANHAGRCWKCRRNEEPLLSPVQNSSV